MTTTENPCCISGVCDRHNLRNQLVMALDEYLGHVNGGFPGDIVRCLADIEMYAKEALDIEVPAMRAAGCTWQQVADATGMNSKQAAQHRFGYSTTQTRAYEAGLLPS